jgi:integrase
VSTHPDCDAVGHPTFVSDEVVIATELRVTEGPEPRFGDLPRWDLSALGLTPNLNAAQAHLRFDVYPDEEWVQIAKTLAMAMLNPIHPVVREAGIYRSNRPYKLKTLRHVLTELKYLAQWAHATGRPADFAPWTEDDCDAYVVFRKTRSASAHRSADDLLRHLNDFRGLMPDGGLRYEARPWRVARSGEVKTAVIPPGTFWPLVRACWTYIDTFAPDIIAARDELASLDVHRQQEGRAPVRDPDAVLDAWLSSTDGYVPLHAYRNGRGRAGDINWKALTLCTTPPLPVTGFHGPRGADRQDRVRQAIRRGLPTRQGLSKITAVAVERADGTRGPWIRGFDRTNNGIELTQLRNAAYIFVAIMTMMRDSEVQSIASNSIGTHFGAPAITATLHKMQSGGGAARRWWVSEPVVKALEVAEKIALDGNRLFGAANRSVHRDLKGFDQYEQIRSFISWVNEHAHQNGLEPIPTTPLAPHMFRRTMAVVTANEPDGEIALGITLKHNAIRALANATTSGYGAPTPEWANEFEHQAKEAAAGELVADWARRDRGERNTRGPGAAIFVNALDRVTDRAHTAALLGSDRMLRNLLRDEFSTIRLGTLNHCLGDPSKAACLEGVSDAVKAGGPIPSMCQPSACRNSVITDKHLPIWQREESDLVEKLKDRKMAAVHRERLQAQLVDVRKITRQDPK